MKKKMIAALLTGIVCMGSVLTVSAEESGSVKLLIAAAASLEYSMEDELIPLFEEQNPGITVEGTYDSSGKLQTQIEEGLEADLFFSAATKQMTALNEEGLMDSESITELLENKIVVIVPKDSELPMEKFEDLVTADMIGLGDPESVPAGQYAREALTSLGLWEEASARASFGTNVTEVLNWVAEGSADAGVVYATDAAAKAEDVVVVAEAPEGSLEKPVLYPVGILARTEYPEEAALFLEFLKSDEAMEIFEKYGFSSYLTTEEGTEEAAETEAAETEAE